MKGIYDALVIDGIVAADELAEARRSNEASAGSVAVHLVLRGAIDEDTLAAAFVAHTGLPRATPEEVASVSRDAFGVLPLEMIDRGSVVPLERTADGWLVVGVVDPTELLRLEGTNFLAGLRIAARIVNVVELASIYERHVGKPWRVPLRVLEGHRARRAQAARAVASAAPPSAGARDVAVQIVALNDEFSQPAIHLLPSLRAGESSGERPAASASAPSTPARPAGGTLPFVNTDAGARRAASVLYGRPAIPVAAASVTGPPTQSSGRSKPVVGRTLRLDAITPIGAPPSLPGVPPLAGASASSVSEGAAAVDGSTSAVELPGSFGRLEQLVAGSADADSATRAVVRVTIASVAACTTREAVARELCDCLGLVVPNAVLFSLRAPRLMAWSAQIARGTDRFVGQSFELSMAPIWQKVVEESLAWRGTLPPNDPCRQMLGRDLGDDTLLIPIVLRDRPVCVLLLDAGHLGRLPSMGMLIDSVSGHVSDALRRVILVRKRSTQTTQ